MLGDFNARVGPLSPASRLHGLHNTDKRNQNGIQLVDSSNNNGLIITNTIFPHKNIHKWTWYHPNQKQGHTVDNVLINQQFRAQIYDTRASRKTLHISDHNIVITKISIKINKKRIHKNTLEATKLDYETNPKKLQSEQIKTFKTLLTHNLNTINLQDPIERKWESLKKIFLAATETLSKKMKYYEKQWVNEEIKNYSKEKSEYHLKMQTLKQSGQFVLQDLIIAYNALKKQTKQACRAAIDNW